MFINWKGKDKLFIRRVPKIPGKYAISELLKINIAGIEQWIYIRGRNRNYPILLMLHGGPGTGQIGFIRKFQMELEKHFVLVQWDQRGSGLSYSKKIPPESMVIQQFVHDTIEVTEYILNRLDKQQLYLVGHSWGLILGMLAINQAPQLYKRYFGVAQVTHVGSGNKLSYSKMLEIARLINNEKAYKALQQIGPPPWKNLRHNRIHQKYVEALGGGITRDGTMVRNIMINLITSKEYTLRDFIRFLQGQFFSMKTLQVEMEKMNLKDKISGVNIPIYFLMGKHDLNNPYELTEQFFNELEAPEKQLIMFENSAHTSILEEPEKFMEIILKETEKDGICQ